MNRTLRRPAKHTDEPMPTAFCLEYTAFRDLHLDWYLRYAYIRTGEWTKATHCVEAAFNALSAGWATVLRSACPAAHAWQLLRDQAGKRATCAEGHSWNAHCLLHDAQADTVLLHHRLDLSINQTANLMGIDDHAVRALLRSAERALEALPPCITPRLPTTRRTTAHDSARINPACAGKRSHDSKSVMRPR